MSQQKIVEKSIRSSPKKYDYVVAAIEESRVLRVLTIDELQDSLYYHEVKMKRYDNISIENAFYSKMQLSEGGKGANESSNKKHP